LQTTKNYIENKTKFSSRFDCLVSTLPFVGEWFFFWRTCHRLCVWIFVYLT